MPLQIVNYFKDIKKSKIFGVLPDKGSVADSKMQLRLLGNRFYAYKTQSFSTKQTLDMQ